MCSTNHPRRRAAYVATYKRAPQLFDGLACKTERQDDNVKQRLLWNTCSMIRLVAIRASNIN